MYYNQMYNPYPYVNWNRQYPSVDTKIFLQSVASFEKTAREASIILKRLSEPQFAYQLMSYAQAGNQQAVDRLIKSIGTPTPIKTKYTPDGLLLTIPADQGTQCCTLTMYLSWGGFKPFT